MATSFVPEPEEQDDQELSAQVNAYLGSYFAQTDDLMDRTLTAIFGLPRGGDEFLLDELVGNFTEAGYGEAGSNVEHTI